MGRAKRDIKKIEDAQGRWATYGKRGAGLLKKAYELAILCDIDVIVITRNPRTNKLFHFSYPNRPEDILLRYLNLPDDDPSTVKDGNGHKPRLVIPNKDGLIAKLQNLKILDMAEDEKISIEQGNSGPKTSGDDNQLIQHTEVINSQVFHQQILDFQRFHHTATPVTPEESFDDYEKKFYVMIAHIEQRKMQLQQQQQSISMQTNAGFVNMQLQQQQRISMHGQQGLAALHDPKNKGKAVMEPYPASIQMQQAQGRANNMQFQQQQISMHGQQGLAALHHLKNKGQLVIREPNPASIDMQQAQGRANNMQLHQQQISMHGQQGLVVRHDPKNKGKAVMEPYPASIQMQQAQGRANNMQLHQQQISMHGQQGLAALHDPKNKGKAVMEPYPASIQMQQAQGRANNMQLHQQQISMHGQQGLAALHDPKNKGKAVMEPYPASIQMQQAQGRANNMQLHQQQISMHGQQGLAARHDPKYKGKAVMEPYPASIQMQQAQGRISMHGQQGLAAFHHLKNKGQLVIREPNPASIQMQQVQGGSNNMEWQQQIQGRADNNMELQQWQQQLAFFYDNSNGSTLLSTEGSVQAPIQTTQVTQQEEGSCNMNNIHINPTNEQNFNQMELSTGLIQPPATSSRVIPSAPLMPSPNTSWDSTYHTTGLSPYFHQVTQEVPYDLVSDGTSFNFEDLTPPLYPSRANDHEAARSHSQDWQHAAADSLFGTMTSATHPRHL